MSYDLSQHAPIGVVVRAQLAELREAAARSGNPPADLTASQRRILDGIFHALRCCSPSVSTRDGWTFLEAARGRKKLLVEFGPRLCVLAFTKIETGRPDQHGIDTRAVEMTAHGLAGWLLRP